MQLNVIIRERVATYEPKEEGYLYVCGNGGDAIKFDFDEEWNGIDPKVARFIANGVYYDVIFSGDTCEIPVFDDATSFTVGVYAGEPSENDEDISASTGVVVPCEISIRYKGSKPSPEAGKNYTDEVKGYAAQAQEAAETATEAIANIEQYKGLERIGSFRLMGEWFSVSGGIPSISSEYFHGLDEVKFVRIYLEDATGDEVLLPFASVSDITGFGEYELFKEHAVMTYYGEMLLPKYIEPIISFAQVCETYVIFEFYR